MRHLTYTSWVLRNAVARVLWNVGADLLDLSELVMGSRITSMNITIEPRKGHPVTRLRKAVQLFSLLFIAVFLVAAASAKAATPKIQWTPDKAFAKFVKSGFEKGNPTLHVFADGCMRPLIPKKAGVIVGIAQEDCLVFSKSNSGAEKCFEVLWENGPVIQALPCETVSQAIAKDTPPGFLTRYALPPSLPVA